MAVQVNSRADSDQRRRRVETASGCDGIGGRIMFSSSPAVYWKTRRMAGACRGTHWAATGGRLLSGARLCPAARDRLLKTPYEKWGTVVYTGADTVA